MTEYNASDTKHIRRAAKAAKLAEADRRTVVYTLMATPAGRAWMHDTLAYCHCFHTTFTGEALSGAYREGQRDVGLHLLLDVMRWAPDQYIHMMREATDREQADARRITNDNRQPGGRGSNGGGSDSGSSLDDATGIVEHEYNPGDDPDHAES